MKDAIMAAGGGGRNKKETVERTEKEVNGIEVREIFDDTIGVNIVGSATDQEIECPKYEKELVHRLDKNLLPILGCLYSVALIDRFNMGNAAVAGMAEDLELYTEGRYNIAVMIFFIPYLLFELPSNIILRRLGAGRWLSMIAFSWGIVMIGMGFVNDWRLLVLCRTMLGVFESGLFPGCVYLISSWYARFEVQKRLAAFFCLSGLIGGFSSLFTSGLIQMHGLGGLEGWRWIFIIEGIITVVLSFLAFFIIIDFPGKVGKKNNNRVFSTTEVEILESRIYHDHGPTDEDPLTWAKLGTHLSDIKLWLFAIMAACNSIAVNSVVNFLPIILAGMGYSPVMCQILAAPPQIFSCIVGFLCATIADRTRKRGPIIVFGVIMCIIGLVLSAYSNSNWVRYLGAIFGAAGCNSNIPAIFSYQSNNIRTSSERAVGTALVVGSAAAGGIVASIVFRHEDAPRYVHGFLVALASQAVLFGAVMTLTFLFRAANEKHRRDELKKPLEGHPDFTYTY